MAGKENCIEGIERTMRQLIRQDRKELTKELSYYGVTVPQFFALSALEREGGECSMSALAGAAQQTLATMTGIADRLARMGLVVRGRKRADRRVVVVRLTRRGERLLEEVRARRHGRFSQALADFDDREIDQLLRSLERLVPRLSREHGSDVGLG